MIALLFKSLKRYTFAAVRERLNIPLLTIADICERYEESGTVENYHGGGYKLVSSPTVARNLNRMERRTVEAR